jgi:hypothetical protein
MCSFNCCVGEILQIEDHVRLQICEAERGHVWIALDCLPGRKKARVEIISPRDHEYPGSGIVGEATAGEPTLKRPFTLVKGPGSDKAKESGGN